MDNILNSEYINENSIRIHYCNDAYNLRIIWDRDKENLPRFPIQIVVDNFGTKWITLLDDIDFDRARYNNVNLLFTVWHPLTTNQKEKLVIDMIYARNGSNFSDGDIIRNPTIEECIDIMNTLREFGYRYNRKQNKFEKVNK